MNPPIYLDHAATTPVAPEVKEAMIPFFNEIFARPDGACSSARKAASAIETARRQVASLIGAAPEEIVFSSGGTESDSLAIKVASREGSHMITSAIEHNAVLKTCEVCETCETCGVCETCWDKGFSVSYIGVDSSADIDPADIENAITKKTVLISIMHANNEVGSISPIEEIGRIAKKHGILLHSDAVQSAGKIPVHVDGMGVDLLSLSSHKIFGPKGIGALYIRKKSKIASVLRARSRTVFTGTQNVPAIVGFGKACEICLREGPQDSSLRDHFEKQDIPGMRINALGAKTRLPNITSLSFDGIEAPSILGALDARGILVSAGAACSSKSVTPSHVLTAMRAPVPLGTIRISTGRYNTKTQIEKAAEVIRTAIARLNEIASLTKGITAIVTLGGVPDAAAAEKLLEKTKIPFALGAPPRECATRDCCHVAVFLQPEKTPRVLELFEAKEIDVRGSCTIRGINATQRNMIHRQREKDFWNSL